MMNHLVESDSSKNSRVDAAVAAYDRQWAVGARGHTVLTDTMAGAAESEWLECAQTLVLRNDTRVALAVLVAASECFETSSEIRLVLAGIASRRGTNDGGNHFCAACSAMIPAI